MSRCASLFHSRRRLVGKHGIGVATSARASAMARPRTSRLTTNMGRDPVRRHAWEPQPLWSTPTPLRPCRGSSGLCVDLCSSVWWRPLP